MPHHECGTERVTIHRCLSLHYGIKGNTSGEEAMPRPVLSVPCLERKLIDIYKQYINRAITGLSNSWNEVLSLPTRNRNLTFFSAG